MGIEARQRKFLYYTPALVGAGGGPRHLTCATYAGGHLKRPPPAATAYVKWRDPLYPAISHAAVRGVKNSHALSPAGVGGSGDGETPFLRMRSHSHAFSPACVGGTGDEETPFLRTHSRAFTHAGVGKGGRRRGGGSGAPAPLTGGGAIAPG